MTLPTTLQLHQTPKGGKPIKVTGTNISLVNEDTSGATFKVVSEEHGTHELHLKYSHLEKPYPREIYFGWGVIDDPNQFEVTPQLYHIPPAGMFPMFEGIPITSTRL